MLRSPAETGEQPGLLQGPPEAAVADMGVERGGRDILMAEQPLEDAQVDWVPRS